MRHRNRIARRVLALRIARAAIQHAVRMAANHRRVREIMVNELAPLHHHERVLGIRIGLAGVHLARDEARIGQRHSVVHAARARRRYAVVVDGGKEASQHRVGLAPEGRGEVVAPAAEGAVASAGVALTQLFTGKALTHAREVIRFRIWGQIADTVPRERTTTTAAAAATAAEGEGRS